MSLKLIAAFLSRAITHLGLPLSLWCVVIVLHRE
jgi:hypothetical protein